MLVNVEFSNLGESQQAKQISQSLYRRGYQVVPMSHGQCHAPEQRRHLHGACFEDGLLHKEKASARLCGNCPFHFNNDNYLLNLKEDLEVLDADRHDYRLPPLQQARAHSDYGNLKRLIELTELTFRANQACIAKTKPTNKNDTK